VPASEFEFRLLSNFGFLPRIEKPFSRNLLRILNQQLIKPFMGRLMLSSQKKLEPPHVGSYGSVVQCAKFRLGEISPQPNDSFAPARSALGIAKFLSPLP
jgi:hypothetical protein